MPKKEKEKRLPPILDSTIHHIEKWSQDKSSVEKTEHSLLEKDKRPPKGTFGMDPTGGSWPKIPQARMRSLTENVKHGKPDDSSAKTRAGTEGPGFMKKSTAIDPDRVDVLYGIGGITKKIADVLLNDEKPEDLMAKIKDRKEEIKEMSPEEREPLDKKIVHRIITPESVEEEEESVQTLSKNKGKPLANG